MCSSRRTSFRHWHLSSLALSFSALFKNLSRNFLLAFAGNLLSDIGVVVLTGFTMVGSDYVHLALVILFYLAGSTYSKQFSAHFIGHVCGRMLAMLQRYLGIA